MTWHRLQRLLKSEQLLACAGAQLVGERRQLSVWLGLGQIREKAPGCPHSPPYSQEHVIFIFTRSCLALEQIFCVVPVVANVRLEVMGTRCALSWRRQRHDLLLDVDSPGAW